MNFFGRNYNLGKIINLGLFELIFVLKPGCTSSGFLLFDFKVSEKLNTKNNSPLFRFIVQTV